MKAIRGRKKGASGESYFLAHTDTVIVEEGGSKKTLSDKLSEMSNGVEYVSVLPTASASTMKKKYIVYAQDGSITGEYVTEAVRGIINGNDKYPIDDKGEAVAIYDSVNPSSRQRGAMEGDLCLNNPNSYSGGMGTDALEVCTQSSGDDEHGDWQDAEWGESQDEVIGARYALGNTHYILTWAGWVEDTAIELELAGITTGTVYRWKEVETTLDYATDADIATLFTT